MKIRNKIAACSMIAMLVASLAMPVFADTLTGTGTSGINVQYDVTPGFTWSIPSNTADITNGEVERTVTVNSVIIPASNHLDIKVSSTNASETAWKLVNTSDSNTTTNYIEYTITKGTDTIQSGGTIFSVASGELTGTATLKINTTSAAKNYAGTYTDTLTFTADMVANS